jgi:hypothetical protein
MERYGSSNEVGVWTNFITNLAQNRDSCWTYSTQIPQIGRVTRMNELRNALQLNNVLIDLEFHSCALTNEEVVDLSEALKVNRTLTAITLTSNRFQDLGIGPLVDAIEVNHTLQHFNISNYMLNLNAMTLLSNSLIKSNVAMLILRNCGIQNDGFAELCAALKVYKTLTLLDVCENVITSFISLSNTLTSNNTLKYLRLSRNPFLPAETPLFFESLKINRSLQEIILNGQKHRVYGIEMNPLCEVMRITQSLTHISLCRCSIEDKGLKMLSDTLENNRSVIRITLWGNLITATGTKHLCISLRNNFSVTELDLSNNEIGDAGAEQISLLLQINQTICVLSVDNCKIGMLESST